MTALLVGGVGIGNAVAGLYRGKTATIATLKCLGASTRLVFTAYLLQMHGAGAGRHPRRPGLGGAVAALRRAAAWRALPVSLRLGLYPAPLAIAALLAC